MDIPVRVGIEAEYCRRRAQASREHFTVSIQESQRHNPTTVPICPRCLKPMVLKGKRPMPFTNLAEETYRCENCGTETKRIIKDR
jgi:C4-type Zn-finger protein